MPCEPQPADRDPLAVSEDEVNDALAACDGDPRATVRALLVGQTYLEQEIARLRARVSPGYCRQRHASADASR